MKKPLRNTLAVALSVVFALTCFALPAGAVMPEPGQTKYFAIGDSIGRGCGAQGSYLDENNEPIASDKTDEAGNAIPIELDANGMPVDSGVKPAGQYDMYNLRNVRGAYTTLLAEDLNCKMPENITDQDATFWPLCYPGLTTAMVLDLMGVEDYFSDVKLDYPYYDDVLEYFGCDDSFDGVRDTHTVDYVKTNRNGIGKCGSVIDLAAKADLITVELGMCDVFYRTYRICSKGGMLSDGAEFNINGAEDVVELGLSAVSEMYQGMAHWERFYPILINKLLELNPNATIAMIGSFNLVNQLRITDSIPIPLGSVFSTITEGMNAKYEEWDKQFGDRVVYVDISNTETKAAEKDWALVGDFMDNTFAGTHPTQDGYNYIERQIVDALYGEKVVTTDIVVDLGRFQKVDSVLLDGKKIDPADYSMDGYKLTVKHNGSGAKNLTITVNNDDGTTTIQTYLLRYSADKGYTAERLYGTSDAKKTGRSFLDMLKSLFQKIIDFFKGLF